MCNVYVFIVFHNLLPVSLTNLFKLNEQAHAYEARNMLRVWTLEKVEIGYMKISKEED